MKKINFLFKFLFLILLLYNNEKSYGQWAPVLSFTTNLHPITGEYMPICGVSQRIESIKVGHNFSSIEPLCNIGYSFKVKVTLYKNNTIVEIKEFDNSSRWFNVYFNNVSNSSGSVFMANVQVLRKRNICIGYTTVQNINSLNLIAPVSNGNPNFNINGTNIPTNGSAINTCISNIQLNASSTTCETSYNINVQECDQWWGRTYEYEFGKWFGGQAPDNINLQALAATYSYPPHYTGNPSRQGSILIGGNLSNGNTRYYRVSVCTGPTWTCKTALIKVLNTCREVNNENVDSEIYEEEIITVVEDVDNIIKTEKPNDNVVESENDLISLFPNPNNGIFNLIIKNNDKSVSVEIFNSIGNKVENLNLKGIENQIDISNYPKGIYILNINIDNIKTIKKVIKQ